MKSHGLLYANGCSFTNHLPLDQSDKWPENLAKELGIPDYINDGMGAGTNQGIFKRTTKFLTETTVPASDILAVIQLTYPFRFEMPTPAHVSGWQTYITMALGSLQNYETKSKTNKEYYDARLNAFAEHKCYEAWEFYILASAISNLLRAKGVDSYFLCLECPEPGLEQPISGDNRGNLTELLTFDDDYVNWMFGNPLDSNMNRLVHQIDMPEKSFVVSNIDAHFNGEANRRISKLMAQQIKLKEQL